jgi:uncharacterized protein
LLRRGVDPNARNRQGYTALMMAARSGQVAVAKMLLDARADRSLRNKKRETALDIASSAGQATIVQMLKHQQ